MEVIIVTRDINGKRLEHYLHWDRVCSYVQDTFTEEDECLLVIVEGTCIYSGLWTVDQMNWSDIIGFFG
jgi:hypothetical protein